MPITIQIRLQGLGTGCTLNFTGGISPSYLSFTELTFVLHTTYIVAVAFFEVARVHVIVIEVYAMTIRIGSIMRGLRGAPPAGIVSPIGEATVKVETARQSRKAVVICSITAIKPATC